MKLYYNIIGQGSKNLKLAICQLCCDEIRMMQENNHESAMNGMRATGEKQTQL
jgi:hypothetical protein